MMSCAAMDLAVSTGNKKLMEPCLDASMLQPAGSCTRQVWRPLGPWSENWSRRGQTAALGVPGHDDGRATADWRPRCFCGMAQPPESSAKHSAASACLGSAKRLSTRQSPACGQPRSAHHGTCRQRGSDGSRQLRSPRSHPSRPRECKHGRARARGRGWIWNAMELGEKETWR